MRLIAIVLSVFTLSCEALAAGPVCYRFPVEKELSANVRQVTVIVPSLLAVRDSLHVVAEDQRGPLTRVDVPCRNDIEGLSECAGEDDSAEFLISWEGEPTIQFKQMDLSEQDTDQDIRLGTYQASPARDLEEDNVLYGKRVPCSADAIKEYSAEKKNQ